MKQQQNRALAMLEYQWELLKLWLSQYSSKQAMIYILQSRFQIATNQKAFPGQVAVISFSETVSPWNQWRTSNLLHYQEKNQLFQELMITILVEFK